MRVPTNCWVTYRQSKAFSCKPSEILGVTSQPTAFYFDRAIYTFGTALEAEMEKAGASGGGKNKKSDQQIAMAKQMVLNRWLGTQKFADPAKRG